MVLYSYKKIKGENQMKKVTVLLALLLCIGMISCDDNADKPATTGTTMNTEASSIETYETITAENTETTVMTTVGDKIDLDAELAGYTVYEVTMDSASYYLPYKDIKERVNNGEKNPEKIALKFTDFGNILLLMENYRYDQSNFYKVNRIISDKINIYTVEDCYYSERVFGVEKSSDMAVFCFAYKYEGTNIFYILKQNEYSYIINDVKKDGYYLDIYSEDDKLCYSKISNQYVTAVQAFHYLVDAYVSDDDFYKETGIVEFNNNQINMESQKYITFGEWFLSDSFIGKQYRDKFGVENFRELIDIYNSYVNQNKENEFYKN